MVDPRRKLAKDEFNPWQMFVGSFVPNWLMERTEVSAGAKLTYARLAQHSGRGCRSNPRVETLAKELGTSVRQTQRYLAELKEHGLIRVIDNSAQMRASEYRFLKHPWFSYYLSEEYEVPYEEPGDESDTRLVPDDDEPSDVRSQRRYPGDGSVTRPVSKTSPAPVTEMSPNEENHSEKRIRGRDSEIASARFARSGSIQPRLFPEVSPELPSDEEENSALGRESEFREIPVAAESSSNSAESRDEGDHVVASSSKMPDLQRIIAAAQEKSRKQREENMAKAKKRETAVSNLAGRPATSAVMKPTLRLEAVWLEEMKKRYPDVVFPAWEAKERGMMKRLLDKYGDAVTEKLLRYVVRSWDKIQEKFFKGKTSVPSLGFVVRFHDVMALEAQTKGDGESVADIEREIDAWQAANPGESMPSELRQRYREALKQEKSR